MALSECTPRAVEARPEAALRAHPRAGLFELDVVRALHSVALHILLECCELLLGCLLTVHLDNASAVIAMGGKAQQCALDKYYCCLMKADIQELVIQILDVTGKYNMQTQYVWVQRDENVIADYLLHEWEHSHYGFSVEQSVFQRLDA
eukprot:730158-Rhodomonas_salina.2